MRRGIFVVAVFSAIVGSNGAQAQQPSRSDVLAETQKRAERITGRPPVEGRYTAKNCVPGGVPASSSLWNTVLKDYKGLPVQDCSPVRPTEANPTLQLKGRALLLLPTASQAAEWIVSACESQKQKGEALRQCARKVLAVVNGQNNLQYVISGTIHEPKWYGFDRQDRKSKKCVATKEEEVLYSFRDGITVRLKEQDRTSFRSGPEAGCRAAQPDDLDALLTIEPIHFANYGRMAGLSRNVYAACTGQSAISDEQWRDIVRSSFIEAWNEKTYSLMNIVAKAVLGRDNTGCYIKTDS